MEVHASPTNEIGVIVDAERDAQMGLIEAEADLKDAMRKFIKAAAAAEGRPRYDHIDIDKFVFIGTAKYRTGHMYHRGVTPSMDPHEELGLIEVLRDRMAR